MSVDRHAVEVVDLTIDVVRKIKHPVPKTEVIPRMRLEYQSVKYTDVGRLHPMIEEYKKATKKVKARCTKSQIVIINALVPPYLAIKINELFLEKRIVLNNLYLILLDKIITDKDYRQHFLQHQLQNIEFIRSTLRLHLESVAMLTVRISEEIGEDAIDIRRITSDKRKYSYR